MKRQETMDPDTARETRPESKQKEKSDRTVGTQRESTGKRIRSHRASLLPRQTSLIARASANAPSSRFTEDQTGAERKTKTTGGGGVGTKAMPETTSKANVSAMRTAAQSDRFTRINKEQPRSSLAATRSGTATDRVAGNGKAAGTKDRSEIARQRQSGRMWNMGAEASSRRETSSGSNPRFQSQTAARQASKGNDGDTAAGAKSTDARTTIARPNRSVSTATPSRKPSSKLPEPARPSFNAFQQHFTPAKGRSGVSTSMGPPARSASTRNSSAASQKARPQTRHTSGVNNDKTAPSAIRTDRAGQANTDTTSPSKSRTPSNPTAALYPPSQTRLLHLTILTEQSEPTLTAYTNSAHDGLFKAWQELRTAYLEQLETCEQARQAKNLLGLHRWTSGNTVALERKLKTLGDVLAELRRLDMDERDQPIVSSSCRKSNNREGVAELGPGLWIGEDEHSEDDAEAPTSPPPPPGTQTGRYARLIQQFERWSDWVSAVWAQRDEDTTSDVATATGGMDEAFRRITRIEAPGDAMKAEIKDLTAVVERLHARLEDLSSPHVPVIGELEKFWGAEADEDGHVAAGKGKEAVAVPTARRLIVLAVNLVAGMREELQVIREVTYEIEVGEREYMRSMVLGTWQTGVRARLDA